MNVMLECAVLKRVVRWNLTPTLTATRQRCEQAEEKSRVEWNNTVQEQEPLHASSSSHRLTAHWPFPRSRPTTPHALPLSLSLSSSLSSSSPSFPRPVMTSTSAASLYPRRTVTCGNALEGQEEMPTRSNEILMIAIQAMYLRLQW